MRARSQASSHHGPRPPGPSRIGESVLRAKDARAPTATTRHGATCPTSCTDGRGSVTEKVGRLPGGTSRRAARPLAHRRPDGSDAGCRARHAVPQQTKELRDAGTRPPGDGTRGNRLMDPRRLGIAAARVLDDGSQPARPSAGQRMMRPEQCAIASAATRERSAPRDEGARRRRSGEVEGCTRMATLSSCRGALFSTEYGAAAESLGGASGRPRHPRSRWRCQPIDDVNDLSPRPTSGWQVRTQARVRCVVYRLAMCQYLTLRCSSRPCDPRSENSALTSAGYCGKITCGVFDREHGLRLLREIDHGERVLRSPLLPLLCSVLR